MLSWVPGDPVHSRAESVRVGRRLVQLITEDHNEFSDYWSRCEKAFRWSPEESGDGEWSWLKAS